MERVSSIEVTCALSQARSEACAALWSDTLQDEIRLKSETKLWTVSVWRGGTCENSVQPRIVQDSVRL